MFIFVLIIETDIIDEVLIWKYFNFAY